MKKWLSTGLALLCFITSFASIGYVSANSDLPLNGIDVYSHLSKNYYWVAHYTEASCRSLDECETATTQARYTLKVVTSRWTPQSFNLVWQRELATNNSTFPKQFNVQSIIDFTQLPKTQLTRGDTIDIAFDGSDTTISVNNLLAQKQPGKALFNYIARIWIGPVPPSRAFKSNILKGHTSNHSQQLVNQFNDLKTSADRLALLDEWQLIALETSANEEALKEQEQQAEPAVVATQTPAARETLATVEIKASTKPTPKAPIQASLPNTVATPEPLLEPAITLAEEKAVPEKSAPENVTPTEVIPTETTENNATTVLADAQEKVTQKALARAKPQKEKVAEPSKAQAQALFEWHFFKAIYSNVEYPSWAKELKQEGEVSIEFVLNKELQVSDIIQVRPTYAGLLGDALRKALEKTQVPLPHWPQKLVGPLTLTYTHQFNLNKNTKFPPLSKALSQFLPTQNKSSEFSIANVREDIKRHVEYPYWARNMKQEGIVSATITLDSDGQVSDIMLTTKSRHNELNKALIAGIQNAAPFLLEKIEKGNFQFTYQHHFKL